MIKSIATGKVLDVERGGTKDGTRVIIWRNKDSSLVEGQRDPENDNQVWFIDLAGNLCSKLAGLPVDFENGHLVLRQHRPVTKPFPNEFSHPLPRISYDAWSDMIRISFSYDPSFPPPSANPSTAWQDRDYVLTSVPRRKPKKQNFLHGAAAALLGGGPSESEFDLHEHEVIEEERQAGEEDDDDPVPDRDVKVLNLPLGWMEKERNARAKERRRWEVIPLQASKQVTRPGKHAPK